MLYADNDAILKLCALDLMTEALECLSTAEHEVRVLDTAWHFINGCYTRKNKKAGFIAQYGEPGITRALAFVNRAEKVSGHDIAVYDWLIGQGIDPGEAILFSAAYNDPSVVLLTGDKRCIAAIGRTDGGSLVPSLKGRVLCFEQVMTKVYAHLGFRPCNERVKTARTIAVIDGMLSLAIRDDEGHVSAAFDSAIRDVKKSCPGLF